MNHGCVCRLWDNEDVDVGSRLLDKKVGCISAKLASTSTNAGGEKVDVGGRENGMIEMGNILNLDSTC